MIQLVCISYQPTDCYYQFSEKSGLVSFLSYKIVKPVKFYHGSFNVNKVEGRMCLYGSNLLDYLEISS